jgi:hypothetical protein
MTLTMYTVFKSDYRTSYCSVWLRIEKILMTEDWLTYYGNVNIGCLVIELTPNGFETVWCKLDTSVIILTDKATDLILWPSFSGNKTCFYMCWCIDIWPYIGSAIFCLYHVVAIWPSIHKKTPWSPKFGRNFTSIASDEGTEDSFTDLYGHYPYLICANV